MITAVIDAGQHYCQAVSDLWQWDYGQTLRIQGVKLPAAVEVQFSTTERIGETVTRIGVTQEGVTEVPIPDTLLEGSGTTQDYTIYAFVYIENGDSGKTEYRVSMKVRARPKPEAHATPEEGELFRQAIVAVTESADRAESARKSAETSADEAKTAKENAETAVKVAEAFKTEAETARSEAVRAATGSTGAKDSAEKSRAAAEKAKQDAEAAKAAADADKEAAEAAQAKAEAAQKAAENAETEAKKAQTATETAKTAVETMQSTVAGYADNAKNAKESAETARSEAETAKNDAAQAKEEIQESADQIQKNAIEIDSLKEDLGYVDTSLFMKEIIEIDYDSKYDGFAQADGLHTHTTRKGYRYNISGKQIIQVRGCAGGVIPLCVCFNSQDTVVQKFDAEKVFDNTVWQTITTPESTAYIYVNDNDNLGIVGCKAEKINKSYNARNHIEKAESDISDIKEDMIDKYSDVTSECSDWIYNTHYDASKTNGETAAERTDGNYSTRKIAVSKGEKYKLTTVVGYAKAYIMADANYDYLGNAYMYPQSSHAWKQEVVNITIPDNCKYLLFTAASEYVGIFKLERLSGLTFEAKEDYDVYFDLENWKERVSEEQAKNDFAWNAYDKGYVTFVMDDTREQTGQFADLFISKNTPLCIDAIPSFLGNLVQNSVHGTTIKEVLNAVVKNGGEILAHGGGTFSTALTADSTDEDYYHAIVDSKKVLTKAGYEINGIITIGGGATAPDYEKCVKIMRPYYRYSDYYGHKTGVIQYDHERLGCYGLTLENLKAKVDECVAKKSWLVLFWHSTNEITLDNMSALIDYINTVNAEIITYKDLHDRFGSSKLEQRIKALESVN